jgi:pyruvate kinase
MIKGIKTMTEYMDLTIAISEDNSPLYGHRWSASLVAETDLDGNDAFELSRLTGYGETPLEAAANLLQMAAKRSARRAE